LGGLMKFFSFVPPFCCCSSFVRFKPFSVSVFCTSSRLFWYEVFPCRAVCAQMVLSSRPLKMSIPLGGDPTEVYFLFQSIFFPFCSANPDVACLVQDDPFFPRCRVTSDFRSPLIIFLKSAFPPSTVGLFFDPSSHRNLYLGLF